MMKFYHGLAGSKVTSLPHFDTRLAQPRRLKIFIQVIGFLCVAVYGNCLTNKYTMFCIMRAITYGIFMKALAILTFSDNISMCPQGSAIDLN